MKSTSSELQIDDRPAVLRSTATRTIGSLGAQEIIPNEGATKTALLAKAWLYFRGDSQSPKIGSGSNSGIVGDTGSGHVGLESLEFISNASNISPPINATLAGFDAFTIGCWVRFDSFGFAGPWGAWDGTGSAGQVAIYNASGNSNTIPQFIVTQDNGSFYQINAKTKSWKVNYWHYCLCEVDTINLIARLWIDNKLQGIVSLPSGFTLNTSIYTFKMGGYDGQSMSGNIEEFVVFNDVLTQNERDWLWNKSYGNTLSTPASVSNNDPYSADVVLLTYANKSGTSFTDETGKTISLFGTNTFAQFHPTKIGVISFPNNAANYGQLAANQSGFWFGSGDWTMEFYVSSSNWYNGAAYFGAIFFVQRNLSDQYGIDFNYYNGNLRLTANADGPNIKTFAWTPSNNIGYLIAIHRDGDNIRCAVNGSQVGSTQSWSGVTLNNVTSPNRFGGDSFNTHGIVNFHGIRITKGVARDILSPDPLPWAYP